MAWQLGKPGGRSRRGRPRTRSGYILWRLRLAAGFTQTQLGHAIGVTNYAVTRWECGRKRPSRPHAKIASMILQCGPLADWDMTPIEHTPALVAEADAWVAPYCERLRQLTGTPEMPTGPTPDRVDPALAPSRPTPVVSTDPTPRRKRI